MAHRANIGDLRSDQQGDTVDTGIEISGPSPTLGFDDAAAWSGGGRTRYRTNDTKVNFGEDSTKMTMATTLAARRQEI